MRKILIFTVFLVAGISVFLVFDKGNISSGTFPELSLEKGGALAAAGFEKVKEKTADLVSGVKEFFSRKSDEAQEKAAESVKNFIGEKLKDMGNGLISPDSSGIAKEAAISPIINSPAAVSPVVENKGEEIAVKQFVFFAAKTGTTAYFTVKNSDEENPVDYSVDWQDGKKDSGKLEKGKSVLISHQWQQGGEYTIDFNITGLNSAANYKVKLTIF